MYYEKLVKDTQLDLMINEIDEIFYHFETNLLKDDNFIDFGNRQYHFLLNYRRKKQLKDRFPIASYNTTDFGISEKRRETESKQFYEKCQHGEKMYLFYTTSISFTKKFKLYEEELFKLIKKFKKSGYTTSITEGYRFPENIESLERWEKNEESLEKLVNKRVESGRYEYFENFRNITISIWTEIDLDILKKDLDTSRIPEDKIMKFQEFIKKWRIPTDGQEQLIDLMT